MVYYKTFMTAPLAVCHVSAVLSGTGGADGRPHPGARTVCPTTF